MKRCPQPSALSRKATAFTWPPHECMPTLNELDDANTSKAKKQDSMARSDFMIVQIYGFGLGRFYRFT